eukprot:TRINITY_DN62485_c0_g1_i1.p1 TRINITY_DN62485_c0_g1~~TRINITY_DN62485_c0_g1_i1.p1  ORF type:complete len:332 (+),score=125.57 TRINITY_DN62485_c0_g1_i1:36-998(+)
MGADGEKVVDVDAAASTGASAAKEAPAASEKEPPAKKKVSAESEAMGLKSKKAAAEKSKTEGKATKKDAPAGTASKPSATAAATSAKPAVSAVAAKPAARPSEGLADDALTQIAQAKFEAQEEKLRDVVRQSMALLRDYQKLDATECTRKIADIQKALLKYEMQHIRAWEFQEQRRQAEVEALEAQTQEYQKNAEAEGGKLPLLREALERERRRRKRYEGYEDLAAEVNTKKSRPESKAEIQAATEEIARLQQQQRDLDAFTEERNERAQQLRLAVEELKKDLLHEKKLRSEVLGNEEVTASAAAASPSPPAAEIVEVIS